MASHLSLGFFDRYPKYQVHERGWIRGLIGRAVATDKQKTPGFGNTSIRAAGGPAIVPGSSDLGRFPN